VSSERSILPAVLLALTAVTGIVDAISYLALGHVFTANMTGNVVFIAFAVAGTPGLSAVRGGLALLAFITGAVLGGRLARRTSVGPSFRWAGAAFGAEATLLVAATVITIGYDSGLLDPTRLYGVIVLIGLAMGIRIAAIRKLGVPDLITIVLTLTIAGLAADSSLAGGTNPRWWRRLGSIASMAAGAAAGAWLLRYSIALPLALCGAVSGICAAVVYFDKGER